MYALRSSPTHSNELRRRAQVRSSITKDTFNSGGQSAEGGSRRDGQ
jgi:hypothetical protein